MAVDKNFIQRVPNLNYVSPSGKEHANTERQATDHRQEVVSGEAGQAAQDARQHQEEVDQRGVRFSSYHAFKKMKLLHVILIYVLSERTNVKRLVCLREIRSKSHEETRQFQENFEVGEHMISIWFRILSTIFLFIIFYH